MRYQKVIFLLICGMMTIHSLKADENEKSCEVLALDIISYEDFIQENPEALKTLDKALHENGIVGIRGIPGYREKVFQFIDRARQFAALPEEIKESYAPNHALGEMFLGYEKGKEKFKDQEGKWVIDDLKVSYYGLVPDSSDNKWPQEIDLKTPFQAIGYIMSSIGELVMRKIGLLGEKTGISIDGVPRVGRLLYYRKNHESSQDNPFWCGGHFDHGMFTALLPSFYFIEDHAISEPKEAGLFVRTNKDGIFKKVCSDNSDVLMFQVGEFGQLATNDAIRATEHRVHKADSSIERYTMALFFDAPLDACIHSTSKLTEDTRYGRESGGVCTYKQWHEASFNRYIVHEN